MKLDVMAIAAHPDDVELCCAGTLAVMVESGKRAGVLDLTRGEMGSRGTPQLRLEEAKQAAKILGLSVRENARLPDCGLENIDQQREVVIRFVRKYKPEICLINAPEDRHPDHRNAARLTLDALFYSGLPKLETRDSETGSLQEPWRPAHILHFMQHWPFKPTIVVDIASTIEKKEAAIRAFSSQFLADDRSGGNKNAGQPDNVLDERGKQEKKTGRDAEPQTFVSSRRFYEALRGRAREYGQHIGVEFGEPFLYYGGPVPAANLDFLLANLPVR